MGDGLCRLYKAFIIDIKRLNMEVIKMNKFITNIKAKALVQ